MESNILSSCTRGNCGMDIIYLVSCYILDWIAYKSNFIKKTNGYGYHMYCTNKLFLLFWLFLCSIPLSSVFSLEKYKRQIESKYQILSNNDGQSITREGYFDLLVFGFVGLISVCCCRLLQGSGFHIHSPHHQLLSKTIPTAARGRHSSPTGRSRD